MATPARKIVHWNSESPVYSDIGSPSSLFSDDSIVSTSSLQYVNSQLVAHGFAPAPGIHLEELSKQEMDRAVKCLLDLLAQRVKDMARTEFLGTELRTLRYDHERMVSMYHTASESAANFEREVNIHKSRLAATTKTLQATEASHKQTSLELQRTRTALQAVRATHHAELKKKDREVERIMEKWNKIADAQAKLGATASGLNFSGCSNATVGEPAGQVLGKGKNFLEVALEEAEKAREQLRKDNLGLRKMILKAVNEVQSVVSEMKQTLGQPGAQTTLAMTLPELFPLTPPDFTNTTLSSALACLRDILKILSSPVASTSSSPATQPSVSPSELERLKQVIAQLKSELQLSHGQVACQDAETQAKFGRLARDHHLTTGRPSANPSNSTPEITVDFITATARDEERDRLETMKKALEEERENFTEAAIQLGKDRVALETDKTLLKERKRSWQVEMMRAKLPATPDSFVEEQNAISDLRTSAPKPKSSPSKRFQISVGKGSGSRKRTRVGTARRSSSILASPSKVGREAEPAFETEVIPPAISIFAPLLTSSSTNSLLPTSFVLPPPSPSASLPPQKPTLLRSAAASLGPDTAYSSQLSALPHPNSEFPSTTSLPNPALLSSLAETERLLPYPVAKPLATRMIHAYSPVRPSPLSRILMLGNSPTNTGPDNVDFDPNLSGQGLEALMRIEKLVDNMDLEEKELSSSIPQLGALNPPSDDEGGLTLAQQLGVSESPPDTPLYTRPTPPLKEKKAQGSLYHKRHPARESKAMPSKVRRSVPTFGTAKPRSSSMTEKGKAKVKSGHPSIVKSAHLSEQLVNPSNTVTGRKEKENSTSDALSFQVTDGEPSDRAGKNVSNGRKPSSVGGFTRGTSGPRRVPLDSAEAPPLPAGRGRGL